MRLRLGKTEPNVLLTYLKFWLDLIPTESALKELLETVSLYALKNHEWKLAFSLIKIKVAGHLVFIIINSPSCYSIVVSIGEILCHR